MFRVVDRHSCRVVGVFPEDQLQQFDVRSYEIVQLSEVKPGKPFRLHVHVQQKYMDESGSRFRETIVDVHPGMVLEGLRLNVYSQLIQLL